MLRNIYSIGVERPTPSFDNRIDRFSSCGSLTIFEQKIVSQRQNQERPIEHDISKVYSKSVINVCYLKYDVRSKPMVLALRTAQQF